jgi:hypothetical protein
LMRGMRLARAITAASPLSLSFSLSLQWASSNSIFIFSFEARRQTRRDKQLAPPSEAHWQRTGRCFTCTPLGSKPDPLFEVPEWAIPGSHHPWSPNSIVDCFRPGIYFFGKDNWKGGGPRVLNATGTKGLPRPPPSSWCHLSPTRITSLALPRGTPLRFPVPPFDRNLQPLVGAMSSPYTNYTPCYLFWHNPPSPSPIPMQLFFNACPSTMPTCLPSLPTFSL